MGKSIVKERSVFREFIDGLKQAFLAAAVDDNEEELPKELKAAMVNADKIMGEVAEETTKKGKKKVVQEVVVENVKPQQVQNSGKNKKLEQEEKEIGE